ncbi:MAG: hypothetical protein K2G04_07060, partial [Oscillospiraceae bacterium]|nr:hypothetical protein [Oscillospiraceae bacterium]
DRFDHKITSSGGEVGILSPDGSSTTVFHGGGGTCEPRLSYGVFCFNSVGPDVSCDYEGEYDLTYYYIDKDGKAVKWYEEKSVYMECHYLCDVWED